MKKFRNFWILSGIVIGGAVLRLINLRSESFWGDESLSFGVATHFSRLSEMIQYLKDVEIHPPLYYILLRYWTLLFGKSELVARIPSVLFGIGVIILVYLLGKRLFSSAKIGLLSAGLVAILPIQIEMSQQARPYVIFWFFGLLASLGLWNYLETRKKSYLAIYIFSSAIGIYLHYSYAFFLVGLAIFWLIDFLREGNRLSSFRVWLASHVLMVLLFAPWLSIPLAKYLLSKEIVFGLVTSSVNIRLTSFFEDLITQLFWMNRVQTTYQLTIFLKFLGMASLGFLLWANIRGGTFNKKDNASGSHGRVFSFISIIIIVPLILFFFSSLSLPYSLLWEKHVAFISIFIVYLLSYLFVKIPLKQALAIGAVFVLSLVPFVSDTVLIGDVWVPYYSSRPAAEFINGSYREGDLVIIEETLARVSLVHYLRPEIPVAALYPLKYIGIDVWRSPDTLGLLENESQFRRQEQVSVDAVGIYRKLDYLQKLFEPERIWFYGIGDKDFPARIWFMAKRYNQRFEQYGEKLPVSLFSKY